MEGMRGMSGVLGNQNASTLPELSNPPAFWSRIKSMCIYDCIYIYIFFLYYIYIYMRVYIYIYIHVRSYTPQYVPFFIISTRIDKTQSAWEE